ncbi:hypothetical protein E2986_13922 [Frieseomelitta varia]|uniref:Uncharacterized protein n=1 Tax=Frieseomelitta varia TaxID=561572 RepID=A0A833SCP8_9HYME|nr:hypothetical protein E2986_13922 [Frieseomelitta varia]
MFLGGLWEILFQRLSSAESVEKSYSMDPESKYVSVFEFDSPLLVIRDLDLIKSITVKNFDHFLNHRMAIHPNLEPLFSKNLLRRKLGLGKELSKMFNP